MPEVTGFTELFASAMKIIGGAGGGTVIGYFAQKQAAKSNAVKELNTLKDNYKEFAIFTKKELILSRKDRTDCQKENEEFRREIGKLNIKVNDLTMAMHNIVGTTKGKRKGLN